MFHTGGIPIERKYFGAFAQQMNKVSSVSAPGVEYPHACANASSENLIEYVNIDMAELILKV
jgi:hypothetical protein